MEKININRPVAAFREDTPCNTREALTENGVALGFWNKDAICRLKVSLRSWRDAWAGEAAIFLEEFSSGEAASKIPACHISYGFCLPPTFIAFDESIK